MAWRGNKAARLCAYAALLVGVLATTCRFYATADPAAADSRDASAPAAPVRPPPNAPTLASWLATASRALDAGAAPEPARARGGGPTVGEAPGYPMAAPPVFGPETQPLQQRGGPAARDAAADASAGAARGGSDAGRGDASATGVTRDGGRNGTSAAAAARGGATSSGAPQWPRAPELPRFTVEVPEGRAEVIPPTHHGPQPIIAVLEPPQPCANIPPACAAAARVAAPYGWTLCLRPTVPDPGLCDAPSELDARALMRATLDALAARAPGAVMFRAGILAAPRALLPALAHFRQGTTPDRWTYTLVLDPARTARASRAALDAAERDALRGSQRVALVRTSAGAGATTPPSAATPPGAPYPLAVFAPARGETAVDRALQYGIAWLFAGADSSLCDPGGVTPRGTVARGICAPPQPAGATAADAGAPAP